MARLRSVSPKQALAPLLRTIPCPARTRRKAKMVRLLPSPSMAPLHPSCSLLPGADFVLNPVIFFYFLLFFVKQKRFCFHTEPLAGTTGSPRHSETSCFLPLRRLRLLPAPSLAPFPRTCSAQTSVRILSSFISFCFLLFLVLKKNNSRFCESY